MQLSRGSDRPEHMLRTEGVETLACVRPRAERGDSRIFQLDVIIGWKDWERLRVFLFSGWVDNPGSACERSAPASKWHLRVNLRGSPPVNLNVKLDPQRWRTTITHEAAVRSGQTTLLVLHDICESGIR